MRAIFVFAFPITQVEFLSSSAETVEVGRASSENKAVLDTGSETLVVLCIQCTIVKTCKGRILIEFDVVMRDVVSILHGEVVEFEGG